MFLMQDNCSLHQHNVLDSPVRAGLQTPWPTHLSVPPLMLWSSFPSVSRGLVYINTPGRTCLHELFIEYEQVTAWVARFSFKIGGKLSSNRRLHWVDQWAGTQAAAATVWLNFKSPVGRNHWPSCWHGSYGIIYNPPQSPQPSMDSHRAINTNDIQVSANLRTPGRWRER